MKKRITALLLILALCCALVQPVFAVLDGFVSVIAPDNRTVVSAVSERITQGVKLTRAFLNNEDGDNQVAAFITTVAPGAPVSFRASYSGYYTPGSTAQSRAALADSGISWAIESVTKQAEAFEQTTGETVLAATNGDYYSMQTGQPLGVLVMEGNVLQEQGEPYFAVLKDGSFAIRDAWTSLADVQEAISGPFYLVKDGKLSSTIPDRLAPVNSIGIKADGTVFMLLADGRQSPYAQGITMVELAKTMLAQGAVAALYLDGGGSATLATRQEGGTLAVRNRPSDGVERVVASALLLVETGEDTHETCSYRDGALYSSRTGAKITVPYTGWAHVDGSDEQMYFENNRYLTGWQYAENKLCHFDKNGLVHNYDGACLLDGELLLCPQCGATRAVQDYTGAVTQKDTENELFYYRGSAWTGWHQIGDEMCHFGSDGVKHVTTTTDTRTCTKYGVFSTVCACGEKTKSESVWPAGHQWDENHVCTVCGTVGIDISTCTMQLDAEVPCVGNSTITPVSVTNGDKTLRLGSTDVDVDGYLTYCDNAGVGFGKACVRGMLDYYGMLEATYKIVPATVNELNVKSRNCNSIQLDWPDARGAQNYRLEYSTDGETWTAVAGIGASAYTLRDLTAQTQYQFRVRAHARVDGEAFDSMEYSPVLTVTTLPEGQYAPSLFTDVDANKWYSEAVRYVTEKDLMNGVAPDLFAPDGTMTRAMLVTVLWRSEGSPANYVQSFTDVWQEQWYTEAVAWAAANAIVFGVGERRFDPNGTLTREQIATILYRYAQFKDMDSFVWGDLSAFTDGGKVSSWAVEAVQWTTVKNLIRGTSVNGRICIDPKANATRAQVAAILMRFEQETHK